jgi:peptide/nickel transport system substrate-binding protein
MKRRDFLAGSTAITLAAPSVRAAGDRKVLKFVPQADIALLDPHFAPALVTRNHAYLVYDTLYGVDDAARPHPQMAAGHVIEDGSKTWRITLRKGLRFHDGEKVLARDAVASLKRWAKRDVYAISSFSQVDELSAVSDDVLQFRLKRPFRLLADLLGKPNPFAPAIMPERLALTEPSQQVKEIIGSGPYRFVMSERVPGSLAVYERNAAYVPRTDGSPVGSTGPKIAYFDRVEWHTIPDASTAAAALQSGEVDWWEEPTSDLLPLLRKQTDITVDIIDTLGYHAVLRFNHLHPPFNNADIRRALLGAFSQADMMVAVAGEDRSVWKTGVGFFTPTSPLANDAGMEVLKSPRDLARVKRNLTAAGYNGERFVFLVPTDLPAINAMSEVAGDTLRKHEHGLPDAGLGNVSVRTTAACGPSPPSCRRGNDTTNQATIANLTRATVPLPTPSALATFLIPSPFARRVCMAASTLALVLGRPRRTPRTFARSRPALTRLRIIARSNSANAPVT